MPFSPPGLRTRRGLLTLAALTPLPVSGCSVSRLVAAVTPTDHYRRTNALAYGEGERQRLDLYVPNVVAAQGEGAHVPVIVFFYGGSWQRGQRAFYAFVGEALASRGFVVAVADYRVYPDVTFPAFVEDAAAAVAWVRRNARRYGGDPSRLVVAGHSAGAHIAMLIALDRDYLVAAGAPGAVAGAIGMSGPYDFLPLRNDRLKAIFGSPDALPRTQPIRFVRADAPPLLLLHGADDTTVWPVNAQRLAERVHAAGGRADVKLYAGVGHIGLIARLAAPLRDGETVLDDIAAFSNTASLPG
jgi:acetyl esterase/lipase